VPLARSQVKQRIR